MISTAYARLKQSNITDDAKHIALANMNPKQAAGICQRSHRRMKSKDNNILR